ncbi:hypothetical protein ACWGMW_07535 [Streptomyces albidoflavus]|uniref:hypothetical protein n=1 Tax=Streptomyces TaxID=1883 RepID=UPI00204487C1|nr:hypothetical protein [Streptomyces sp. DR3-1]MCM3822563.1 hypothetical protein [Streptomyces sp. DR3-1]
MSQNKIVVPGKAEAIVEETAGGEGVWAEDRVAQVLERLASDFVLDNTWRALRVRAAVPGRGGASGRSPTRGPTPPWWES